MKGTRCRKEGERRRQTASIKETHKTRNGVK